MKEIILEMLKHQSTRWAVVIAVLMLILLLFNIEKISAFGVDIELDSTEYESYEEYGDVIDEDFNVQQKNYNLKK
jgi:hypothetical protein